MGSNIGWFIKASCKKKRVENKNIRVNNYGVGMAAILVSTNNLIITILIEEVGG